MVLTWEQSKLGEFCKDESSFRVTEQTVDYKGFDYVEDYLQSKGLDTEDFIDWLAFTLWNKSELWIDSDAICNIMFDTLEEYEKRHN